MSRMKTRTSRKSKNGSESARDPRAAVEAAKMRRYLAFVRAVVGVTTRGSR